MSDNIVKSNNISQINTDTSIKTLIRLKNYIATSQIEIYKAIIKYPNSTRKEISEYSNHTINNTSGRVRDLIDLGLVTEGKQRKCKITNNIAYEIHVKSDIDWGRLSINKINNKESIKLNKKHLSTIMYLLKFFKKNIPVEFNLLKKYGIKESVMPIVELERDIKSSINEIKDGIPFFVSDKGYSYIWKAKSENSDSFYDIEYLKSNKKISCSCDDYKWRHKKCKHIQKLENKLKKIGMEVRE